MLTKELCDANPDCLIALDGDGIVVYINPSGVDLWEFESKDAALGRRFIELWPVSEQERIAEALGDVAGHCVTTEGPCVTGKGNRYWLETRFTPLRSAAGSLERTLCICRDFSASYKAKASLAAQELDDRSQNALYREIIDSAIDTAIIGTDSGGRIILWSQGARQITG
jgi:PAS domain S-box-containing protein